MKKLLLGSLLMICLSLAIHPSVDLTFKIILLPLFIILLPDYVKAANDD